MLMAAKLIGAGLATIALAGAAADVDLGNAIMNFISLLPANSGNLSVVE